MMYTDFICYVIEEYRDKKGWDGKTVILFFKKNDIIKYLIDCYPALHTVGTNYIIDEIDEITSRGVLHTPR